MLSLMPIDGQAARRIAEEEHVGTDWARAYIPKTSGSADLEKFVEQQAVAFQSMWGWSSHACSDYDSVRRTLHERLHMTAYRTASDSLRKLLTFPERDDAQGRSTDALELALCWRVYAITYNPTYPPLWRLRANRTFLPHQLPLQVREWRRWAEQAAGGEHDDYLRELHLHETSDFMHYHWSYLHGHATASLNGGDRWEGKPALAEVRERILQLHEPDVINARVDPADENSCDRDILEAHRRALFNDLTDLLNLTRAWSSMAPPEWKVPDYEENYDLTFEAFKERARNPWLLDFLQWAEHCAERGFALYLDY
jgi:hypothetical protein